MLELARRIGNRVSEWTALSEMTYVLTMLGRWDDALARLAEIPEEYIGADAALMSVLTGVLEIHVRRGDLDQARALLARYKEISQGADVYLRSGYHFGEAAIRLAEGNLSAALEAAEQAVESRAAVGLAAQNAKLGLLYALEAAFCLVTASRSRSSSRSSMSSRLAFARPCSRPPPAGSGRGWPGTIRGPIARSSRPPASCAGWGFPSTLQSSCSSTANG